MFSGASNLVVTGGNFSFNEPRNATQGMHSHLDIITSQCMSFTGSHFADLWRKLRPKRNVR